MKHLYKITACILLCLPLYCFAQSNYKPGYIVTNNGDTVRGAINLREWENSPHNVDFKTATGVKNYKAKDIRGFGALNLTYQQYAGPVSTDATNISRLSTGRDTGYKLDTAFLQILQKGPSVTLYSYVDNIKIRYFIADNRNNLPFELIYRIYYIPDRGVETHLENVFVSQLYGLAQKYNPGSDELRQLIEQASYNTQDLKKISEMINKMTYDTKDYGTTSSVRFFAGVGINITRLKPTSEFRFYNPPTITSVNPTLSGGANIYINPNVGQFIARCEILFTRDSYNTVADVYFNQPEKPKSQYHLTQYIAVFYPQLVFNAYNTNDFKFYLDAGLAFNFSKNKGDELYNGYTQVTEKHYLNVNSYWINYPVKVGIVLNRKIDISIAYIISTSITNNISSGSKTSGDYSLNLSSILAGVHYNF